MSEEQTDTKVKEDTQSSPEKEEKPLTEIIVPDFKEDNVETQKWDEPEEEEQTEEEVFGI